MTAVLSVRGEVQNQAKDRIWVRASPPAQVRVWSQVLVPVRNEVRVPVQDQVDNWVREHV